MIESLSQDGAVWDNPEQEQAAVRAVLWRVEQGLLAPADARLALRMLGLVDDEQGTKRDPNGKRLGTARKTGKEQ